MNSQDQQTFDIIQSDNAPFFASEEHLQKQFDDLKSLILSLSDKEEIENAIEDFKGLLNSYFNPY